MTSTRMTSSTHKIQGRPKTIAVVCCPWDLGDTLGLPCPRGRDTVTPSSYACRLAARLGPGSQQARGRCLVCVRDSGVHRRPLSCPHAQGDPGSGARVAHSDLRLFAGGAQAGTPREGHRASLFTGDTWKIPVRCLRVKKVAFCPKTQGRSGSRKAAVSSSGRSGLPEFAGRPPLPALCPGRPRLPVQSCPRLSVATMTQTAAPTLLAGGHPRARDGAEQVPKAGRGRPCAPGALPEDPGGGGGCSRVLARETAGGLRPRTKPAARTGGARSRERPPTLPENEQHCKVNRPGRQQPRPAPGRAPGTQRGHRPSLPNSKQKPVPEPVTRTQSPRGHPTPDLQPPLTTSSGLFCMTQTNPFKSLPKRPDGRGQDRPRLQNATGQPRPLTGHVAGNTLLGPTGTSLWDVTERAAWSQDTATPDALHLRPPLTPGPLAGLVHMGPGLSATPPEPAPWGWQGRSWLTVPSPCGGGCHHLGLSLCPSGQPAPQLCCPGDKVLCALVSAPLVLPQATPLPPAGESGLPAQGPPPPSP